MKCRLCAWKLLVEAVVEFVQVAQVADGIRGRRGSRSLPRWVAGLNIAFVMRIDVPNQSLLDQGGFIRQVVEAYRRPWRASRVGMALSNNP
jgi:hypothetical protein